MLKPYSSQFRVERKFKLRIVIPGKDINLPIVKVTVDDHGWAALLDTGASRRFIHPVCAGYFKDRIRKIRKEYSFGCAWGKEVCTDSGIPDLKVKLGELVVFHDFLIACLGYDVLIGFDILQKVGLVPETLRLVGHSRGQWVEGPVFPRWEYDQGEEIDNPWAENNRRFCLRNRWLDHV
ncbi:reverse [Cystoisospora suis]|uniref:Reverse n=1 Tax=Cystoisospora suis TaxID=483139 RepID=A0A2C6K9M1_9APIC|nr:reverse [Cystoisospora suis]